MKSILSAVAVIVLVSCGGLFDRGDFHLFIENASGKEIACLVGSSYPDTRLPSAIPNPEYCLTENIVEKSEFMSGRAYNYSDALKLYTQQGILSVYIFSQKDVDENGWEDVLTNNRYLVRYDLSAKDLDRLSGTIYFPPTEEMKDVKMSPAYQTVLDNF